MIAGLEMSVAGTAAPWSRVERYAFGIVACGVWILTVLYSLFLDREVFFDEVGLFNPIYQFLKNGTISYPLHGQPDFMTVHPPTHYVLLALLMKTGLPLFVAAVVPLLTLTTIVVIVIATGRFRCSIALALLLGLFSGSVVWADYAPVRPDLHLTLAWFSGLVMLEAAKNRQWSPWRLMAGSALSTYAATLHYWGIASIAAPLVYSVSLLLSSYRDRRFVGLRLASVAIGGLSVGLPFLVWFVVPRWHSILAMVGSVQSDGGVATAIARHLASYSFLASVMGDVWQPRPIVTSLLYPILQFRIPAVVVALLAVAACRRYTLAVAGCVLPAFVFLYSQQKSFPYYTPEMTLYFTGVFMCGFVAAEWFIARSTPRGKQMTIVAVVTLVIASLAQVPSATGRERVWTRSPLNFELMRAAAFDVVGPHALLGMISLGPWYTGGATYPWIATNELTEANRSGRDIEPYFRATDMFVIDRDWWHALPDLAPLGPWYLDRRLSLRGFVLPTSPNRHDDFMLFATARAPTDVRGYFLSASGGEFFQQVADGTTVFSVWQCPRPVPLQRFAAAFYRWYFNYNAAASAHTPVMLLLGNQWDREDALEREARAQSCRPRDIVRGRLSHADASTLLTKLRAGDRPIQVATTFSDAFVSRFVANETGRTAPVPHLSMNVDWDKAAIDAPAGAAHHNGLPLVIEPPADRWAYGAVLSIRVDDRRSAGLLVRVRARILKGSAGVGIATKDEHDFLARNFRDASGQTVTFNLIVPAGIESGPLVVQNGQYGGDTLIELQSIDVLRLDESSSSPLLGSAH